MIKCDAVVLANGDFPVHAVPLSLLENAAHIVACDGAITHLTAHDSQADIIAIGDGDSVPAGSKTAPSRSIILEVFHDTERS